MQDVTIASSINSMINSADTSCACGKHFADNVAVIDSPRVVKRDCR